MCSLEKPHIDAVGKLRSTIGKRPINEDYEVKATYGPPTTNVELRVGKKWHWLGKWEEETEEWTINDTALCDLYKQEVSEQEFMDKYPADRRH